MQHRANFPVGWLVTAFLVSLLAVTCTACANHENAASNGPETEDIEPGEYGVLDVTVVDETTVRLEWTYGMDPDAFSVASISEDGSLTDLAEVDGTVRSATAGHTPCVEVLRFRVTALVDGREYPVATSGPVDVCDMLRIPEGVSYVGCDQAVDTMCREDELPLHAVTISPYWMDRTEVSFENYSECSIVGACAATAITPADIGVTDAAPVLGVNWSMANDYCAWRGKRLPTEAEWEKAGRGGTTNIYPWGNDWNAAFANWDDGGIYDGFDVPAPVASFLATPSPYGVVNLSGNVWEWVGDYYAPDYYGASPTLDPAGPETGERRVTKGGAWRFDFYESRLRLAYRNPEPESGASDHVGFRCARN